MSKKSSPRVQCLDCKHSQLLRWDSNPIIADCKIYGKDVASVFRYCSDYSKSHQVKPIKQLTHHAKP